MSIIEFFITNAAARWTIMFLSVLVSVGLVSSAEGGLLKNSFWVPLALMLGAGIYGAAVFANFGKSEGSAWLILPAALAVAWNALNTVGTLLIPFLTGANSASSLRGGTLWLLVLFLVLGLSTVVVGGVLGQRLEGG